MLKTRRSYLDALIRDYNSYFASLVDLDAKENRAGARARGLPRVPRPARAVDPERGAADGGFRRRLEGAALWLVDPDNYVAAARRVVGDRAVGSARAPARGFC